MICSLYDLKKIFNIKSNENEKKIYIEKISTDSRSLEKNSVFLAIKGENFDGHDFVKKAIDFNSIAIIVSEDFNDNKYNYPNFIKVKDTIKAYGEIAKYYRNINSFKVVAITGSSGKTTTKDMVASVLEKKYKVEKTNKNYNNEIGLPYTILNANINTEVLVLEMGMRALGEIEYLTKIASPDIGIITNIGIAHIGELGSQQNILQAKGELLESLPKDSIAIISGEDGFTNELKKKFTGDIRVVGFNENATLKAINIIEYKYSTKLDIISDSIITNVEMNFKGKHLILDALIAIETGNLLNICIEDSIHALNNLEVTSGRLELIKKNDYLIINDTYNANPDSMKKSIDVLISYDGNKIAVLGDMKELGDNEIEYHKEIGRFLAEKELKALITVGDLGKFIGDSLLEKNKSSKKIFSFMDNQAAAKKLSEIIAKDDVILFKGSRAMRMEEIIKLLEEEVV
ncbi:MAG: UDP-N-acetylmuramoyl-tripeptide--D-alanyl-D-alanine ligase [Firmicutes bacterium]|nr:UDP-N-acetylmuramoyl-tripeptide--D-alanyl-D-alanine ligase [Bacillota bacterium]